MCDDIRTRFWGMVATGADEDCWLWQRSKNHSGYGMFSVHGKARIAHRIAYELTNGPIPKGLLVCHHCDTPLCCNPGHLFIGTQIENIDDRHQKGRSAGPIGESAPKSKLSESDVIRIRELGETGELTHREIAALFGVTHPAIGSIIRREAWKHVG